MGDTGASGGMSPRRPQTRVRSGAYLGGRAEKSNRWTESSTVLDSSDADPIRFYARIQESNPTPPAGRSWTVWTVDCKLFVVSSANLIKDNGAEPSALLLAVIQTSRPALKPRAAAGPDSRLHASPKLGIPRCVTYVRRR